MEVLPGRSGDARSTVAPSSRRQAGRQALERAERVVGGEHDAGPAAARHRGVLGRDEDAPRAGRERLRGERAAVAVLADEADEEVALARPRASR